MKPALRLHLAFAGLGVTAAAFPAILPTAVVAHGDAALAAPGTLFAGLLVGVLLSGLLARSGRLARTLALGAALQAAGLLAATAAATAGLFVAAAAISGVGFGITEAAGSASARTVSRNAAHALTGLTTSVAAAAALAPLLVLGGAQVGATGAVLVVFATVNAAACVAAATAGRAFDEQPARRGTATHARFGAAWVGFAIALVRSATPAIRARERVSSRLHSELGRAIAANLVVRIPGQGSCALPETGSNLHLTNCR